MSCHDLVLYQNVHGAQTMCDDLTAYLSLFTSSRRACPNKSMPPPLDDALSALNVCDCEASSGRLTAVAVYRTRSLPLKADGL